MCSARRSDIPPLIETPKGGVMLLVAAPARNAFSVMIGRAPAN
jgi:hypothetical protein